MNLRGRFPQLRGFSISVFLRMARLAVNLVLTSFLARYLGGGGFGQIMVAMSITAVLLCAAELGLGRITVRELVRNQTDPGEILGSTFFSRLTIGIVLYGALLIYVWVMRPEHTWLLVIYGSLLVTHSATELVLWLESAGKVEAVAWAQMCGFLVSAAAIGVGVWAKLPVWYFACTYVLECWAAILVCVYLYLKAGGQVRGWRWSGGRATKLLRESWFELASQLALLLLFRIDTIMVEMLRGKEEAGVYGAAVRVSEVMYFLPVILSSVCLPTLVSLRSSDPDKYRQRFADYFGLSLLIAVPSAALLALAAPLVVMVLFGDQFAASAPILVIHAWSFIPYAIGVARTQYLTSEGRLWVNLPSVLGALIINVVLNWFWIPSYGGLGAAWATLIAYTTAWLLSSFLLPSSRDVSGLILLSIRQLPTAFSRVMRLRSTQEIAVSGKP